MRSPKVKGANLEPSQVTPGLPSQTCPSSQGHWIAAAAYEAWQSQQLQQLREPPTEEINWLQDLRISAAETDIRAGLCPECGIILTRLRVPLKTPFYLERCAACSGIWCDRGEWQILEQLGLHIRIPQMFSSQWQMQVREQVLHDQERQSLAEKLGPDLAQRVMGLAETLESHPHSGFAIAYLTRRAERRGDISVKASPTPEPVPSLS
ncbi:MAG: zf-TFIIB domain-containing protein [Oscillatoriales cyanobacterium SM2_2_1]|nr:zf-TFIIB domain-containing protein [Oscillatoriales cyanobacterium SM2_2_1]